MMTGIVVGEVEKEDCSKVQEQHYNSNLPVFHFHIRMNTNHMNAFYCSILSSKGIYRCDCDVDRPDSTGILILALKNT